MDKYTSLCDVDPGLYKHARGNIWMVSLFPSEALDGLPTFQLRDTDVLTATYPKAGQTWLLAILYLMDNADKLERGETIEKQAPLDVPFIEMHYPGTDKFGYKIAEDIPGPRTLKTHLPLCYWKDTVEKSPNTKVIQVVRNPKDTLVSYFHFCRMNIHLGAFNGTWDEFFDSLVLENPIAGGLFEVTADWYNYNKTRDNSLTLFYEDMKKDLRGNIRKLSDFLKKDLSDRVIDIIAERTTFNNMSKDPKLNKKGTSATFKEERSTFLRKGQVGDWKEYFNDEQNAYVDGKVKKLFDPIGLKFDYM